MLTCVEKKFGTISLIMFVFNVGGRGNTTWYLLVCGVKNIIYKSENDL